MRHLAVLLWRLPVRWRRLLLSATVGCLSGLTCLEFSDGLFSGPRDLLSAGLGALFAVLALFAAVAWVLRLFGFIVGVVRPYEDRGIEDPPTTRTAIVMPIYHEDVDRVALGIERTWLSAKASSLGVICDFFVLSDSTDEAIRAAEERACGRLLTNFDRNEDGSGRLFLIRRQERGGHKAGNIANFLHLHGADYEFMLVLDADSVMTGNCIRRLIRKLELRPRTALVQSLMAIYRSRTLFARITQSSQNPQMALYSAGLRWLLGPEGIYWGHNAVIRIKAFAEHAMLPIYPWEKPGGGPVLSQDVHEASLLGRAGWAVDLDLDEGGSFEEMPANVVSNAERDRRWCQGDYLNLALVLARGIRPGQRIWLFYIFTGYFMSIPVIGIMLLGSIDAARNGSAEGIRAGWIVLLNIYLLQLIPKGLAFVRSVARHGSARYGLGSFAMDTIGSILFGPLMLYLNARIIIGIVTGQARPWKSPPRNPDDALPWTAAVAVFWPATLVGLAWIAFLWAKAPTYLAFCGPVMAIWLLSIPMAVSTSRVSLADWLADHGWMRASFTDDETQTLGPLILAADLPTGHHDLGDASRCSSDGAGVQSDDLLLLTPALATPLVRLGGTEVDLCAGGLASTRSCRVRKGWISAQRLLLLSGIALVLVIMAARLGTGR